MGSKNQESKEQTETNRSRYQKKLPQRHLNVGDEIIGRRRFRSSHCNVPERVSWMGHALADKSKAASIPGGRSFLGRSFFLANRRFQSKSWKKTPANPPGRLCCFGCLSTMAKLISGARQNLTQQSPIISQRNERQRAAIGKARHRYSVVNARSPGRASFSPNSFGSAAVKHHLSPLL